MSSNPCKITGCNLHIMSMGWLHGDLFFTQGVWIFNGVRGEVGQARWTSTREFGDMEVWPIGDDYFERAGVVVFAKAGFNQLAKEYINAAE